MNAGFANPGKRFGDLGDGRDFSHQQPHADFATRDSRRGYVGRVAAIGTRKVVNVVCWTWPWTCIGRCVDNSQGNRYVYWTMAWSTVTGHRSEQSQAR
jgi:hypothetical protein